MNSAVEVAIVGAGAAGIAATRRLVEAGVPVLLLEARDRVGGRAWTAGDAGFPIDLGCGWLHSADRNPWRAIAEAEGWAIDRTPPPWARPVPPRGEALPEDAAAREAVWAFRSRLDEFPEEGPDAAAASALTPGGPYNAVLNAVSTFYSGAELERVSARDLARYDDTGVNWRVVKGYGALIAHYARGLPVRLNAAVTRIDHSRRRVRLTTAAGTVEADSVIVTLPTGVLAAMAGLFSPALPEKVDAAAGLPLGLADKLYLALDGAEEFRAESRAFGRTDRAETAGYHFRPLGHPVVEGYFGGAFAAELEKGGAAAFADVAVEELAALFGADMRRRLKPVAIHLWGSDPHALGSYSYARPGHADDRARLAAPVADRIFFAGEACSRADYSTAHGAYATGVAAAEAVLAARDA